MDVIKINGARTHNLKNIDLALPRGKFIVLTGLSGSGKSSLAFDTLYAEGQRRYVESLSTYARQFLGVMPRPDVDSVEGLSPAIAIDQKGSSNNPRSTVGTVTEIADYLRLLMARTGVPYCPEHGHALTMQSIAAMVDKILSGGLEERVMILTVIAAGKTGDFRPYFMQALSQGYMRFRIDGKVETLDTPPSLDDGKPHTIELVVDRLRLRLEQRSRLAESCQKAAEMGNGHVLFESMDSDRKEYFSTRYACPECEFTVPKLEPTLFSPNSPRGCCPACNGTGKSEAFDESLVVATPDLSLESGAIRGWDSRNPRNFKRLSEVAEKLEFSLQAPWSSLPRSVQEAVLFGNEHTRALEPPFEGVMTEIQSLWDDTDTSDYLRQGLKIFRSPVTCPLCGGYRLRPDMLSVYVGDGSQRYNICDLEQRSLSELKQTLLSLEFTGQRQALAERVLGEIVARLTFLENVGLGYLTLDRRADTLSGGESQRIRLASQIGSKLTGILYVLDEPSIGLHQQDNDKLIDSLKALRDQGNTLIVVEHDEDAIRAADYIVDMGPGAGELGGRVMAAGTPEQIKADPNSLTGAYLSGKRVVPVPEKRLSPDKGWLVLEGARGHNLKEQTLRVPVGLLTTVSGVSGSGKSSLVVDTLYNALACKLNRAKLKALPYKKLSNAEQFEKVVMVDQAPIGRTPRSNPATYTGLFKLIREVFEQTQMARERGYTSSRFSFNVKGGRCESCQGDGLIAVEMHFLPTVYVPCDTCHGTRYNRETLEVKYKDFNISQVLDMTVAEAVKLFENHPKISRILSALMDVGLGYIRLGQSATTFSGGEAQRIKLATELARPQNGRTFYILDEPTTGLHFHDIAQLMDVLRQLTAAGNTVLVIEHNLDVIKSSDWVIDMGPSGGAGGGQILVQGTPETVAAAVDVSPTAPYLARALAAQRAGQTS